MVSLSFALGVAGVDAKLAPNHAHHQLHGSAVTSAYVRPQLLWTIRRVSVVSRACSTTVGRMVKMALLQLQTTLVLVEAHMQY